ncbi:hypothetical protein ABZ719_20175 [Streptomyces sp. NPDC006743]|uniref:hypothetical protein n=1 Tax=Streptomyces sp. NPDC006743 TaxID=3154480 RepID=UPI003454506E
MTGHRSPVPRDMPDQQADVDEDPWETARSSASEPAREERPAHGAARDDVPGADEEQPVPDEPSA